MIDKQKHAKEFRLRILLTNRCDRNCPSCLNDFQKKGGEYFIDPDFVEKHIEEYVLLCENKGIQPIISLSGGEPGLHPEFALIVQLAVQSGAKVQLNTNGLVDDLLWDKHKVDVRYHMGHDLRNKVVFGQTAVFILSDFYTVEETKKFIEPFYLGGMKIKTFAEYFSSEYFRTFTYPVWLLELGNYFPLTGRHTGVQENRGNGCDGCKNECVTLKALWLFPDNTSSFCPQGKGKNHKSFRHAMTSAYLKHKNYENQLKAREVEDEIYLG